MSFRVFCVLAIVATSASAIHAQDKVDFGRDILPILSENCFQCHGPDENTREADLRLDTFAGATRDLGGYQALTPTKPESSELIRRAESQDPAPRRARRGTMRYLKKSGHGLEPILKSHL